MPGDDGAGKTSRTVVRQSDQPNNNRRTTEYRTVRRWPLARGDVERPRGVWVRDIHATAANMTGLGNYARQTADMMNIELGRIIHQDREREIEAELRRRRLIRPTDMVESTRPSFRIRPAQRPASTGATSR
jgi:hypothetical protein